MAVGLMLLGMIWGSFVAALCVRWPKGESIVTGRSRCDHCAVQLASYELIPLVSYALQHGRCRHCLHPIGLSSLLIEIVCAGLGLIAAFLFSGFSACAVALFFWLLVPLAILDGRYLWLPGSLIAILALAGLFLGEYASAVPLDARLIGGAVGFAILSVIRLSYRLYRGVDGMGGGDPKLLGAIGLWTGWQALPIIVMLASAIGLAWFFLAYKGKAISQIRLPLGTFMAIGAAIFIIAQPFA
jgi:leader peptidase (prepilin peptidase) / N-methyltransferase